MDKKSEFKKFLNKHPEILRFIKNKEMTFQDFYEIYDIYGEENDVWNKYFKEDSDTSSTRDKISELTSIFKNINMDNIEHHVNNAQKAISIIQELTKKSPEVLTKVDRPISKFFGD